MSDPLFTRKVLLAGIRTSRENKTIQNHSRTVTLGKPTKTPYKPSFDNQNPSFRVSHQPNENGKQQSKFLSEKPTCKFTPLAAPCRQHCASLISAPKTMHVRARATGVRGELPAFLCAAMAQLYALRRTG